MHCEGSEGEAIEWRDIREQVSHPKGAASVPRDHAKEKEGTQIEICHRIANKLFSL